MNTDDWPMADLTGLDPKQAYALGALTGELVAQAEARGYANAIAALRDDATLSASALWSHEAGRLADHLEAIANQTPGGGT